MATPNYSYEKRQRELAKKLKSEGKRNRKAQRDDSPSTAGPAGSSSPSGPADGFQPPQTDPLNVG